MEESDETRKDRRMNNIYIELFNKIDLDKNGYIDYDELSKWLNDSI